jgi:hypothetical protein
MNGFEIGKELTTDIGEAVSIIRSCDSSKNLEHWNWRD